MHPSIILVDAGVAAIIIRKTKALITYTPRLVRLIHKAVSVGEADIGFIDLLQMGECGSYRHLAWSRECYFALCQCVHSLLYLVYWNAGNDGIYQFKMVACDRAKFSDQRGK